MKKETLLRPFVTLAITGIFFIVSVMDMFILLSQLCAFPAMWMIERMSALTKRLLNYDIVLFTR